MRDRVYLQGIEVRSPNRGEVFLEISILFDPFSEVVCVLYGKWVDPDDFISEVWKQSVNEQVTVHSVVKTVVPEGF